MIWNWTEDDHITSPVCAIKGRVMRPAMTRDQDFRPGYLVLSEDGFACTVHFSSRDSDSPKVRFAQFLGAGGDWRLRDMVVHRQFDTLERQRRYLGIVMDVVAVIPPDVLAVPGQAPTPFVLRLPVFRDGYWSPYSQFLLPDPAN